MKKIGFNILVAFAILAGSLWAIQITYGQMRSNVKRQNLVVGLQVTQEASPDWETLVRAKYDVKRESAEAFTKLLEVGNATGVELATLKSDKPGIVKFQVTTDEVTQKSIANFLARVIPSAQTVESKFQQVSLRLPGMT